MTENQIQMAASDDPGDWSPEVQFLAREVVRLREDALEVVRLTDGHECGQRLRDRAEKAESNADDLRRALKNTTRDLSEALDRAEKAEAEVVRLRSELANTVKMDESPSKDQHIDKLNEDIKDLVSRCRRAENRAEYAEGRLRIAEADIKDLVSRCRRAENRAEYAEGRLRIAEASLAREVTALRIIHKSYEDAGDALYECITPTENKRTSAAVARWRLVRGWSLYEKEST